MGQHRYRADLCGPMSRSPRARTVSCATCPLTCPREIAAELSLSTNTVKTHQMHLYRKLGAHSRYEAVRRARAVGLIAASRRMP